MARFTRIAMFSGPRNISTTMMRSFENRPDTAVYDEPFYACYLAASGAPHPMREETLAAQPNDWEKVVAQLHAAPPGGKAIAFEKHIAFHFGEGAPLDWIAETRMFMLIRDPRAMVASYKNKYDDVAPIVDSFAVQRRLYEDCERGGGPCPIVDARDILTDPAAMLAALCHALEIPFREEMLVWPAGPRETDGPWAPHWYDAVWASTGFKPYRETRIDLPDDLEQIAKACRDDYEFFYERRLRT